MKPWPKRDEFKPRNLSAYLGNIDEVEYERARADAAIERLRIAVEELNSIAVGNYAGASYRAQQALAQIGELP